MKIVPISEFKAKALAVIGQVAKAKESVVVLKRGKPVAKVVPFQEPNRKPTPGRLSHTLVFEKDIVSPLGEEMWEAGR